MDRLETGLILEVIDWDEVDKLYGYKYIPPHTQNHMCKCKRNFRELMLKIEFVFSLF